MASSSFHLFLFFVFASFSLSYEASLSKQKPQSLIFPIKKDNVTLQYSTSLDMGTPLNFWDGVIDLGGQSVWLNCDKYNTSTYRPIRCGSSKCKAAKGSGCSGCNAPRRPGCTNNTCGGSPYNPFENLLYGEGLIEDVMNVHSTDGKFYLQQSDVPHFIFSCADSPSMLKGLAKTTKGMVGFTRNHIALPMQIALAHKLPPKFALCIPSSTENGFGDIFIGGGPYFMPPYPNDMSKSLFTTPLLINPVSTAPIYTEGEPSDEYFIGVRSIKVDGKLVPLNASLLAIDKNGVGGTKLSTIAPYTILHTSIYKAVINDFVNKAAARKIKRVTSVKPFGACFSSKTIMASTRTGPAVPTIDLVLQSKSIYWRVYGANSMVKAGKDVLCLGFVDGGSNPRTSIVLGGHQLENNLIEFDLASSKLGFSSSLLLKNTSCSQSRIF
ncbi:probable aspartic proteinase GIP2 [Cornus florida]|uniref:probable aspartic proteinase GIP2 n=1 Tax=Cornus florida TaxID=4283 RepID=UPI002897F9DA|nr:probable aspartic proteinase GIP2 [Cornus florida]